MKKITFIKTILSLFISAFLMSCASEPEPQAEPVQNIQETSSAEINTEDLTSPMEEPPVFESETAPEAENDKLEPIDDEEGFYMSDRTVLENTGSSDTDEITEKDSETKSPYEPGETYYKKYFPKESEEDNSDPYLETDPFEDEDFSETQESSVTDDVLENNYTSDETAADDDEFPEKDSEELTDSEHSESYEENSGMEPDISAGLQENQEEDNFSDAENSDDEPEEEISIPVPSRSVTIKKNQYLEIKYPGSGWVYLGETDDTSMMRYFGRKRNSGSTSFTLRARDEGTTLLHFYKNDALTDEFIDDYLEVTVSGTDTKESRVTAPDYETAVPPAPKNRRHSNHTALPEYSETPETVESSSIDITPYGSYETGTASATENNKPPANNPVRTSGKNDSNIATVIQNADSTDYAASPSSKKAAESKASEENDTSSVSNSAADTEKNITEGLSSDEILEKAQSAFDDGEYEKTLNYLDAFFDKATEKIDSGLYLQAQTYETNSSVRNIKNALETYETIVRDYPQSINWTKAYERMTYLKRFYFNIR